MDASVEWSGGGQSPLGESLLPCTSAFLEPGQEDIYLRDSHFYDGRPSPQGLTAGDYAGSPGQLMGATWPSRQHQSQYPAYPTDPPLQASASPAQAVAQYHHAGQLSPQNPTLLAALDLAPAAASNSPPIHHYGAAARSPGGGGPMTPSAASPQVYAQAAGAYGLPPQAAEAWGAYQQQVRASQQALDARFAGAAAAATGGGCGSSPSPPFSMAAAPAASPPVRASQPFPSQYAQHQAGASLRASLAEPYTVTVVEQLRTSPLPPSGAAESPIGRPDLGGPSSSGGGAHGGSTGGDKGASSQRYQAQILSLERQNAELQKRLADVQAALEAAQQGRRALEAKSDTLQDEVAQAKNDAKARETALETARRANDALSSELRGVQEELSSARDALAEAKDTAVQWQDRAMEAAKELDATRRKMETLGEEERRLSAENMVLRKEVQQLNDAIIKGRIETSELRDKLRQAQQDGARAASEVHVLASRAESEQESAAVQLVLMRNRVAELEARNSQMVFDLAAAREESARARQAAEATKAALAAKPAGIISELGPAARHYGTLTQAWLGNEGAVTSGPAVTAGGGEPRRTAAADRGTAFGSSGAAPSADASAPASTAAAVLRELPRDVAFSKLDPETFRSMVRAEAEALARSSAAAGGRAAASYDAGGHGSSAYDARPASPPPPRYGGYGGMGASMDALAAEHSSSSVASGLPAPSSHPAWAPPQYGDNRPSYDSKPYDSRSYGAAKPYEVRDSLAAMLPDPRSSWVASLAEARGAPGYGAGGDGGAYGARPGAGSGQRPPLPPSAGANQQQSPGPTSPPPPYAIHTADSSYAYRRPPNAVGAGAASAAAGGGVGADGNTPFGTEDTSKALLARSKALEDQLMVLCAEKGGLEAEYARMPLGAGRSLRERNRKAVVEQRLELLNKEISAVRMQLKRIGIK